MNELSIIALPTDIADDVRRTLRAPGYGHPAHVEPARGYGPCRHCLRTFTGESANRILFTYDPFRDLETLPLPGPVFVHAEPCERFPEDGFPDGLLHIPMTLNAYARGRLLLAQVHGEGDAVRDALPRLFERGEVAYVHVRNREAGCFMFRVERTRTAARATREAAIPGAQAAAG